MARKHFDLPKTVKQGKGMERKELQSFIEDFLLDAQLKNLSKHTLTIRKDFLEKFVWFLEKREFTHVSPTEIKSFLLYLQNGHLDEGGRFGNPKLTAPLKTVSINGYFRVLRSFFNYLEFESEIWENPIARIKAPSAQTENKQPISDENVEKLLGAARKSSNSKRDEALLLLLLDTGLRASELCSLRIENVDFSTRSFKVLGKGRKFRMIFFGLQTHKSLLKYLRTRPDFDDDDFLFVGRTGAHLTANSLKQLTMRLAESAGIDSKLCGPHAFRRTFAVSILRAGANLFSVQAMLGHTDLQMTRRYVSLADADVESQHRQFSPVDRMRSRSR